MSADPAALQALAVRTKVHLRYFELVKFTAAGHNVTCFLAVGKHALFLVRRNLGGLYPNDKGGEIYFAFISSMVEDSDNATDLLLLLSESGALAWKSEKLFAASSLERFGCVQTIGPMLGVSSPVKTGMPWPKESRLETPWTLFCGNKVEQIGHWLLDILL